MKKYIKAIFYFSFSIFHFSFSHAQNNWLWEMSGNGNATIYSLAADNMGNCFAAGFLRLDTIKFGSNILSNPNVNFDDFLLKIDPIGNILWTKQTFNLAPLYTQTLGDVSISTDASGNTYYVAEFPDTMLVGSDTLISKSPTRFNCTYYVAKYDPNGNVLWSNHAAVKIDTCAVSGYSISADYHKNCYVTGLFNDTITIGTYILSTPSIEVGFTFLAKYDSNGNVKWAKQSTGNTKYGATAYGVGADRNGNSYITGHFADTITFGSFTLSSNALYYGGPVFIVKYDSSGNVIWAKQSENCVAGGGAGWSIATDLSGNVYIEGAFADTIIFDNDTLIASTTNRYQQSIFLLKYDTGGVLIWAKQTELLDNNTWNPGRIATDKYNHIYFEAGAEHGNCKIKFGDTTLQIIDTAKYDGASFIIKTDSNGNVLCANILMGGGSGIWQGLAVDNSGSNVYFGGFTSTPLIFGSDTVNPFSTPHSSYWETPAMPFVARWDECDVTLGVPQIQTIIENSIKLYPNPNNGNFTLVYNLGNNVSGKVIIYNTLGEMIGEYALDNSKGSMNISNPQLSDGVYIWMLYTNDKATEFGKIIIIK